MSPAERNPMSITLRGFLSMRWALVALVAGGQALLESLASSEKLDGTGLPVVDRWALFALAIGLWVVHAVHLRLELKRAGDDARTTRQAGLSLLVDTTALSVVFLSAGGASNPFTALYFVPIVLATQVSPRWTGAVGVYTALAFAGLFVLGDTRVGAGPHAAHFAMHLRGMWIAFAVSGAVMTFFVHRIAVAVAGERAELARVRAEALEDRHLAAIGTLAAGAAHELGTPLATMTVLAEELPHMSEDERAEAVGGISRELERCKGIVQRMASPELRADRLGRGDEPWELTELKDLAHEVEAQSTLELDVQTTASARSTLPRSAVRQLVRELLSNAQKAARDEGSRVALRTQTTGEQILIEVEDDGPGMSSDAAERAFEPFWRGPEVEHKGSGLGLAIVRNIVVAHGGEVSIGEGPEGGCRVVSSWPTAGARPADS